MIGLVIEQQTFGERIQIFWQLAFLGFRPYDQVKIFSDSKCSQIVFYCVFMVVIFGGHYIEENY